jgi:hypothetical protein
MQAQQRLRQVAFFGRYHVSSNNQQDLGLKYTPSNIGKMVLLI